MKFDMGGSAAVLGAAKAIGEIKPPGVEVTHLCSFFLLLIIVIRNFLGNLFEGIFYSPSAFLVSTFSHQVEV